MYSDFNTYANLFLQIPDGKTKYDRLINVVKWYLSAFKSRLTAKKPYNPVLGEIFQCLFTDSTADQHEQQQQQQIIDDCRPLPWAGNNNNDVIFFAEQVSHHPPVSAFYVENIKKKIQINGYGKTRSKFLGLSVGVETLGNGLITLIDLNEQYKFTYPNACVKSILTEPQIEMTGLITIKCEQTGYSADINFLLKPFYGGKKHQIQGNIYGPNRILLNTIEGDWTNSIYIKSLNDFKNQVLLDTNSLVKFKVSLNIFL